MSGGAASNRLLLGVAPFCLWCWLAMLLTHELGHIVAVPLTGGRLAYVNVYPGQIPSTLASSNPRPVAVLWAGFASGWLIPQAVAVLLRGGRLRHAAQSWSGFCWLAGGAYLAFGWLERYADGALLHGLGWPLWLLAPTGLAAAAFGYARCRVAWPAVVDQLASASEHRVQIVAGWAALAAWIGCQWLLAAALDAALNGGP